MVFRDVVVFVHLLIVLLSLLGRDLSQGSLGEDSQQIPGNIQTLEDVSDVIRALGHEAVFELVEELEVELVFGGKSLFSDNCLHSLGILADSVVGVKLN